MNALSTEEKGLLETCLDRKCFKRMKEGTLNTQSQDGGENLFPFKEH